MTLPKIMYKGLVNSPETTITNNINTTDIIIYVLDPARVPADLPNLMVLGTGTNAETVKVMDIDGSELTVERGFQGIAKDWLAGTIIARNFTEYDYGALVDNLNALEENKETPAGAQSKANTAENAAKTFASGIIGSLSSLLTTAKDNIVAAINELFNAHAAHLADGVHQKASITNTDDATSTINAPLKSAGGLAIAKKTYLGNALSVEGAILKNYNIGTFANSTVGKIAYTGASYQIFSARIVINVRQSTTPFTVSQKEVLIHTFLNGGTHFGQTIAVIREIGVGNNISVAFVQISDNNHEIQITNNTGAEQTYFSVYIEAVGNNLANGFGALTV